MLRQALFLLPLALLAQDPVAVSFSCAENDLQSAGLLCTEDEPCPIYLEINSIAPAGKKLFLAGDLHATAATLSTILLSSDDGGKTWKEPAERIPGGAIDQLQIYDLEHGWAAGEIQYPLSRDPFFLVTSDGGLSWRRREVSDEGGPGSLLRFWFDSAQHGELIIDAGKSAPSGRYIDYESETGGESWMMRSTTAEQPKLRRAPPSLENSDFRVRPSASGKTYQVEKRDGEKWDTMASLQIEVASCKLKAGELKEPPPVTDPDAGKDKDYVEELKLGSPTQTVAPGTPGRKPAAPKTAPKPSAPVPTQPQPFAPDPIAQDKEQLD